MQAIPASSKSLKIKVKMVEAAGIEPAPAGQGKQSVNESRGFPHSSAAPRSAANHEACVAHALAVAHRAGTSNVGQEFDF